MKTMLVILMDIYDYIVCNPLDIIINILVAGFWISVIMIIYSFIKERMSVDEEED